MFARRIAVACCCLAMVAVSGCSSSDGVVSPILLIKAPDRQVAPDLSGSLVGGGHGDLSTYAGKVVVLNVWASWCGPCREEAAGLVQVARTLPNVAFMGIDIKDLDSNAEAFKRAHDVPYPSFYDQDSRLILELQRIVSVPGQPNTVILDKQHRVAVRIIGPTTPTTLTALIRPLERAP